MDRFIRVKPADEERRQVRDHLMEALGTVCAAGDSKSAIRLARFLLRLIDQRKNEVVYARAIRDEGGGGKPVDDL